MARWSNFSMWRGRLPHWRADGVRYYVTFRHRRALRDDEIGHLFSALLRAEGRQWNLEVLCVLPESSELIAEVAAGPSGEAYELSDIVERAKKRAGKAIVKKSGERFAPFYGESYDRIVRDDDEFEALWTQIVGSPDLSVTADSGDEYRFLWVAGAP